MNRVKSAAGSGGPFCLVLLLLSTACSVPPPGASAPMAAGPDPALEGAWRLVSSRAVHPSEGEREGRPRDSLLLFAGGFYSMNWVASGAEPKPYATRFRPTDEEALARYKSLVVNAGTYQAADGRLVIDPEFALVPEFVHGKGVFEYVVEGDELQLTWTGIFAADGQPDPATAIGIRYVYRWVRFEPPAQPPSTDSRGR